MRSSYADSGRVVDDLATYLHADTTRLSLRGSHLWCSLDALTACPRLWHLDLRSCGLTSIQPLVALRALGTLDVACNKLSLRAALTARHLALGRLELAGNLLRPQLEATFGAGEVLDVQLRCLLVDSLPLTLALDGSYITLSERRRCREYAAASDIWAILAELRIAEPAALTISIGRDLPEARALRSVLAEGSTASPDAETDEASRSVDGSRLAWLARDFDPGAGAGHPTAATQRATFSLSGLARSAWLNGSRRLALMVLLAHSLLKPADKASTASALPRVFQARATHPSPLINTATILFVYSAVEPGSMIPVLWHFWHVWLSAACNGRIIV